MSQGEGSNQVNLTLWDNGSMEMVWLDCHFATQENVSLASFWGVLAALGACVGTHRLAHLQSAEVLETSESA